MNDQIRRWLRQVGIEIKAKRGRVNLLAGLLLWVAGESLKHRIFGWFNEWQDTHKEKTMDFVKTVILWFVDHPYILLVVVIAVILGHSYWKSQHGDNESEELNKPNDPRIAVAVVMLEEGRFSGTPGIVITNVGGSEADKLGIEKMTIGRGMVEFDSNIPILKSGDSTHPLVPTITGVSALFRHDLVRLMLEDWGNQTGGIETKLLFPARAEYEDSRGKRYEATWDIELYPFNKWDHQNLGKSMDTSSPYLNVSSVKNRRIRITKTIDTEL